MTQPVLQPVSQAERSSALKFVYASGSRPLQGYTIKRGVGRGGFGEVYYAVSDAGKEVALKLVRRNLDVEVRGATHCLNLKHPNLLSLFDIRQDEQENSWVIMEYVSGESLEEVIERSPNGMSPTEVVQWMRGIVAGVGYLHDHGIVHRDLKPGNIFVDEGIIKLGDYGLAKFMSCSRRSGQTDSVGTVHYMAPEVANGRYGKEIDIYALGVILFKMLTGRVPFEGESVGEVLMKHLTAQPDLGRVSEPFRSIVAKCLDKDPERRYRSVEELSAALPAGAATSTAAPPLPQYTTSQSPRHGHTQPGNASKQPHAAARPQSNWGRVKERANQVQQEWNQSTLSNPIKVLIVVLVILAAGRLSIPLLGMAMVGYGAYRLIKVVSPDAFGVPSPSAGSPPTPNAAMMAAAAPMASPSYPPPAVQRPQAVATSRRWHKKEKSVPAIVIKPLRERLMELTGSMLLSSGVVIVLSLVMLLLRQTPPSPEQFAWLALVCTVGTWAVLIPAKFWEGTKGEAILRRFVMLVVGLGFGLFASTLDDLLLVTLPNDNPLPSFDMPSAGRGFFDSYSQPMLYAYLTYFGFLFFAVRWWRQADPLRSTRLSLWSTACAVFVTWALTMFWPFPQPWGYMVAGIISISAQLTSPWLPYQERAKRSA